MIKETAHRNTAQRKLIYDVIQKSLDHPTAETVYIRARQDAPHISLGTVYRNLNHLSENGAIRRLSAPIGPDHFDFNLESHYHFLCSECGQMSDIPSHCSPDEKSVMAPSEAGFDIKSYSLIYVGVCPECKNKHKKEK
ncbi:MAG: transcriptional repressor [Oscillospiraceae bacterium]|nr:transcriptional repressor [Oscillospiraceae bacterium]